MILDELKQLLQESVIISDKDELDLANTSTFETSTSSKTIVKTGTIADLKLLVRFCNENELKLSVISCGKNWGFGSKVPVEDVDILLDLSLMNSIISYDELYGAVRIEPGVTFRQLYDFLKTNGNKHFLNTIGGDPDSSVLGNILERGDGVGPYCERSDFACSSEVILGDGEIVNLGFDNFRHSQVMQLNKSGIGPNFQEIFFQSNFGIVTKITIWLCTIPKNFKFFNFCLGEDHDLSTVLDKLRSLYQKRILTSPITFWNDYKQVVNTIQMPWAIKTGPSLDRSVMKKISNNYNSWYCFGGIYIDHSKIATQTINEIFRLLKKLIKKKNFLSVISNSKIRFFRILSSFVKKSIFDPGSIIQLWKDNPLLGHPMDKNVRSLFWRKKMQLPEKIDPGIHKCGLYWNSFIMPFCGNDVFTAISRIEDIIFKHGFEPVISLVLLNDRYIKAFQQLIFDREVEGDEIRANACHNEIFEYLEISGYSHTRLGILSMEQKKVILKSVQLHKRIKSVLDPNKIISAGKYFV